MVSTQSRQFYTRLKRGMAESLLSQAFNLLSHSSDKNCRRLVSALTGVAKTEHQRMIAAWIAKWVSEGNPGPLFFTRAFRQLHPNVRKRYLAMMITNLFFPMKGQKRPTMN